MPIPSFDSSFGNFVSHLIREPVETAKVCYRSFSKMDVEKSTPRLLTALGVAIIALYVFKALAGRLAAFTAGSLAFVTVIAYQSWSDAQISGRFNSLF